eukprot:scaffold1875_cov339-Prasinococcus_capsulatus_cf.AAC.14
MVSVALAGSVPRSDSCRTTQGSYVKTSGAADAVQEPGWLLARRAAQSVPAAHARGHRPS